MEYDHSKNTNVMDIVHHLELGIEIDGGFDVQSKICFVIVDYCQSRMHFMIAEAYLTNDQHNGNWYMNHIY